MNLYSVYGACLATTEEFPELRPLASGEPRWTFVTTPRLEAMHDAVELGAELIYGSNHARLFRHAAGYRITVDDTGVFDLSADLRSIRWQHKEDPWPDFVRAHLIGRVLATALFVDGWLPLHGSAVAFPDGVVAFLAPKGFGKSSLAYALTAHGATLVTDDTLAVELGDVPYAWPGVHSLRIRGDSLTAMGEDRRGPQTREGKTLIADLDESRLAHARAPLRALYLLAPVAGGTPDVPARQQLPTVAAAAAAVGHVKIAGMLGVAASQALLDRCAVVARSVPVYSLAMPRDLAALPGAAARIASWHSTPTGGARA